MIEHVGKILSIEGRGAKVLIEQYSACSACQSKSMCAASEKQEKIIDAVLGDGDFCIGEKIVVMASNKMGFKSVLFAFIIPLFLLLLTIVLSLSLFHLHQEIAAIISVLSLLPYYLILYLCRNRMGKDFMFYTKKI